MADRWNVKEMEHMNRIIKYFIQIVLFAPLFLPLTACALSGDAIEGKVLEEGTKRPIPGAIVVARWLGNLFAFAESQTVCVHVLSTTTDAAGKYRFPAWRKKSDIGWVRSVHPVVIVHKTGYEAHLPPGYGRTEEYRKYIRYLKPSAEMSAERLRYLLHLSGMIDCHSAGNEKSLVSVYKTLYDEAKKITSSDEDKYVLQAIRRRALYAWSRPSRELTSNEIEQAIKDDPYLREQFQ